ncbi:MAG: L,D-transpeptidase family protein [Thermoanaerobaculia bacterium]
MNIIPGLLAVSLAMAELSRPVTIESAVETLKRGADVQVAGERICAAHPLPLFYARRNLQPAWSRDDDQALLDAVRHAVDDGLDPDDYHLAAIERSTAAERDLLLTDAFFLFASHLLSGRVDPVTIEPTWCLEPRTSELVPALETALENHDVAATLDRFRCTRTGYCQLREHLARYRRMSSWPKIDAGRSLRRGDKGARVDQLVARLIVSGELDGIHPTFDARVREAVQKFQRVHGLDADGVAGGRTLRELNVPLPERVRQIELNLERWRWLPAALGARHALINIPQFQLSVVDNDKTVMTMRIVVGKDFEHRTPVFSSEIKEIVFSPYWNVPDSIAAKEVWPEQLRDPAYFEREHIEVLANGRLRQKPGPWNALGFIKFNLPNPYSVYLHDTPARTLFSRSLRTFSHGCIRIEKPVELATWLLRDSPGWTMERVVSESQTGVEHSLRIRNPLPVHILYWTAFVDEAGELNFAPDIYGRDAILDEAMRKAAPRF